MVVEFSGVRYCNPKLYNVQTQNSDGRVQLKALHPDAGFPDTLPLATWGPSGISTKYKQGTNVLVAFVDGDPGQPFVLGSKPGTLPLESTVDATTAVHIGPSAANVDVAGGGTPVALSSPYLDSLIDAMVTAVAAATPGPVAAAALAAAVKAWSSVPPGWTPGANTVGSSKFQSG